MYNNFDDENDQFNRMQSKIKDTIESMVSNNYTCNNYNDSCVNNKSEDNQLS